MTLDRHMAICCTATLFIALLLAFCPRLDLAASGLFYAPGKGFLLAHFLPFLFLQGIAFYGARVLGIFLLLAATAAFMRKRPIFGIGAKGWAFLLLALLIGPGLIANVALKDHWGRARPREVTEFGGHEAFSPALSPQPHGHRNGSFVSGDAAFGFFLPAFAYVVPERLKRRIFRAGLGAGTLFGFARIAMGAHFLSDVLFAALFMLAISAGLHKIMYGRAARQNLPAGNDGVFRRD